MGDLIIVLIIAACVYCGMKRGVVRTAVGAMSSVVGAFVGFLSVKPLSSMLEKSQLGERMGEYAEKSLLSKSAVGGTIAATAAKDIILKLMCFVIVAICVKTVIAIAGRVVCLSARLPVIKQADALLGGAAGFIGGIVICYVLLSVARATPPEAKYAELLAATNRAYLSSFFYNTEFLAELFVK